MLTDAQREAAVADVVAALHVMVNRFVEQYPRMTGDDLKLLVLEGAITCLEIRLTSR